MKKLACALILSSLVAAPAFAKGDVALPASCDYSDLIHMGDDSISGVKIASLTGDANIVLVQKDDTSFYIKDAPTCPSDGGVATVKFQKDGDNYCVLKIHDGPSMWDPEVDSTCTGDLHFSGIKSDGIGKHAYSLSFY
jgi:hypothetical protein